MSFHLLSRMDDGDAVPRMMSAVLTITIVAALISILLWFMPEEEEGSKPIDTSSLALYKASPDPHSANVAKSPWTEASVDSNFAHVTQVPDIDRQDSAVRLPPTAVIAN